MTAADYLAELESRGLNPVVKGGELLTAELPDDLIDYDAILHSGVVALLTDRRWFAVDKDGRGCGRFEYGAISPHEPMPAGVYMVHVEGPEHDWEKLPADAEAVLPECFHAIAPAAMNRKRDRATA